MSAPRTSHELVMDHHDAEHAPAPGLGKIRIASLGADASGRRGAFLSEARASRKDARGCICSLRTHTATAYRRLLRAPHAQDIAPDPTGTRRARTAH